MTIDKCPGDDSGYFKLTWKGFEQLRWHSYRCVWFDANELKSEDFGEHLLVAADSVAERQGTSAIPVMPGPSLGRPEGEKGDNIPI